MLFDMLFTSELSMRKCFDHSVLNSYFSRSTCTCNYLSQELMSLTGRIFANRIGRVGERLPKKIVIVTFHSFFFCLYFACKTYAV